MNTYRDYNYEIINGGEIGRKRCIITLNGHGHSSFEADHIDDDVAKKEIDYIIRTEEIDNCIRNNSELCMRLADTYEKRSGYSSWRESQVYKFVDKNWNGDAEAFTKKLFKTVVSRENNKLSKTLDHLGEMSIREFRHAIEKLTDNKVCVNGGKAYLHIYNWLFKEGKRTCYRCHNYYISIGQNFARTEENAKMIADKCMKFAAIENYGQNETIPVEKF